eukprot:157940-Prorocentrum_minimum.AAC.2
MTDKLAAPFEPPCRKKEFKVDAEHEHWNFLKGSGPSAPPRVVRAAPDVERVRTPSAFGIFI